MTIDRFHPPQIGARPAAVVAGPPCCSYPETDCMLSSAPPRCGTSPTVSQIDLRNPSGSPNFTMEFADRCCGSWLVMVEQDMLTGIGMRFELAERLNLRLGFPFFRDSKFETS